jgi:hypothetical protein
MTARTRILSLACALALLTAGAVVLAAPPGATDLPPPPARDNGTFSWVRQVVPVLYGRKPRGYTEIRLLAELADRAGRGPVLAALMEADEFVEHWAGVLEEHLRVSRGKLSIKDLSDCFTPSTGQREGGAPGKSTALADHIRAHGPDSPYKAGGEITMGDVVRSSLRLDDVSPVFLAHLFAMVSKPADAMGYEIVKQADLFSNLDTIFLNRKAACLSCHNSSHSVTDRTSFWPRAHPIPGHFEEALYESRTGPRHPQEVSTFLRTDVNDSGPGSVRPWGWAEACGQLRQSTEPDPLLPLVTPDSTTPPTPLHPNFAGIRGVPATPGGVPVVSVFDLESQLRRGFDRLRETRIVTRTVHPADRAYCKMCQECEQLPDELSGSEEELRQHEARQKEAFAVIEKKCGTCHTPGGGQLPHLLPEDRSYAASASHFEAKVARTAPRPNHGCALVAPRDVNQSYVWRRLFKESQPDPDDLCSNTGRRMPPGAELGELEKGKLKAWIGNMPRNAGCRACRSRRLDGCPTPEHPEQIAALKVEPDQAFAAMAAASFVNRVWTEAVGHPLTIANYFPRSEAQGERLTTLTETVFIKEGFSLKKLLAAILANPPETATPFNRSPPSLRSGDRKDIYDWPLELDPWSETDPRRPPVANDGWAPASGLAPDPNTGYVAAENPENHRNAMTEGVRRYPAYTLVRSVYTALGWYLPSLLLDADGLDQQLEVSAIRLAREIGIFTTDAEPGFRSADLQSLLAWEDHVAACARRTMQISGEVVSVMPDWFDRLAAEIRRVNAASPQRPLTRREVLAAVKDWLVGDMSIAAGQETEAVAALLGWTGDGALDQPFEIEKLGEPFTGWDLKTATTEPPQFPPLDRKLRRFCGVLVQSPQFQFAGVAPAELTPAPPFEPRLRVCNEGQPCSRSEICQAMAPAMAKAGYRMACPPPKAPPGFTISARPTPGTPAASVAKLRLAEICPPGRCYVMAPPQGCRGDAASCVRALPLCDPRSGSCGGPTDLVGQVTALNDGAVLVAEVEGARVAEAGDARLQGRDDGAADKARQGYILKGGDVLRLRPGEEVVLDGLPPVGARDRPAREKSGSSDEWIVAADKWLMTPPKGRAARAPELAVVVTGPSLRASWQAARTMKPLPLPEADAALKEAWRAHGEAGAPLGPSGGMPPFTAESLRRHWQRNRAAEERMRRTLEVLKARQARGKR